MSALSARETKSAYRSRRGAIGAFKEKKKKKNRQRSRSRNAEIVNKIDVKTKEKDKSPSPRPIAAQAYHDDDDEDDTPLRIVHGVSTSTAAAKNEDQQKSDDQVKEGYDKYFATVWDGPANAEAMTNAETWRYLESKMPGIQFRTTDTTLKVHFESVDAARNWVDDHVKTYSPDRGCMLGMPYELLVQKFVTFRVNESFYLLLIYIYEKKAVYHPETKQWTFHHFTKPLAQKWVQECLVRYHFASEDASAVTKEKKKVPRSRLCQTGELCKTQPVLSDDEEFTD